MALDQHWKDMYSSSVTELAGDQFKPELAAYMQTDSVGGEHAWFDSYAPLDSATDVLVTDDSGDYRMEYEEAGSTTFADWKQLQTPHTEISKTRSLCAARRIEAGYTFRELDDVSENSSPKSWVLKQIMRRIAAAQDAQILNVLTSTTQQRGKDLATIASVAFPTAQVLSITAGVATFDKDICATILQKYEENYVRGEQIFMVITPAMKASLVINSGDTIQSSDFVNGRHLEDGTLPDVYGISFIVHPLMSSYNTSVLGTHAEGIAVAFSREWGFVNKFKAIETQIDQAAVQRFSFILYIREFCNAVRVDDSRVVIVGFGTVS